MTSGDSLSVRMSPFPLSKKSPVRSCIRSRNSLSAPPVRPKLPVLTPIVLSARDERPGPLPPSVRIFPPPAFQLPERLGGRAREVRVVRLEERGDRPRGRPAADASQRFDGGDADVIRLVVSRQRRQRARAPGNPQAPERAR